MESGMRHFMFDRTGTHTIRTVLGLLLAKANDDRHATLESWTSRLSSSTQRFVEFSKIPEVDFDAQLSSGFCLLFQRNEILNCHDPRYRFYTYHGSSPTSGGGLNLLITSCRKCCSPMEDVSASPATSIRLPLLVLSRPLHSCWRSSCSAS